MLDNLNTHTLKALYEEFLPTETRRLAQKLELHYTLTNSSWLNMAEIELSVLSERIGNQGELQRQVDAWQRRRNQKALTMI